MIGDTIAAVSTPRGKGGVALLRVSGPDAVAVSERIFTAKNGKSLCDQPPRYALYGTIWTINADGARVPVDDGIATVFRAPASFTGEDTVELCCHGGILLTETVLTALFTAGARPAEAGEFTKRAFLNGKMGLSSAEALGNMLEAETREQLTLAHAGMGGRVEGATREIYDGLGEVLASIYAKIDYPDEDLADLTPDEMCETLRTCAQKLEKLVHTYRTGHAIAEGIPTVICGKPNVGKSSLYNRLIGRDAAIVTDVEGTTRDVLSESVPVGKILLRLYDTAGLHESDNPVEKIGMERTRAAIADAELIFAVFDGSSEPNGEDLALIDRLRESPATVVAIVNKADLGTAQTERYRSVFPHTVVFSAKSGAGVDELTALLERLFTDGEIDTVNDAVLTNARQHAAAENALAALREAIDAIGAGLPVDLCCADAEHAMALLGELDGRTVSEDIVAQIFSHFCVGK